MKKRSSLRLIEHKEIWSIIFGIKYLFRNMGWCLCYGFLRLLLLLYKTRKSYPILCVCLVSSFVSKSWITSHLRCLRWTLQVAIQFGCLDGCMVYHDLDDFFSYALSQVHNALKGMTGNRWRKGKLSPNERPILLKIDCIHDLRRCTTQNYSLHVYFRAW